MDKKTRIETVQIIKNHIGYTLGETSKREKVIIQNGVLKHEDKMKVVFKDESKTPMLAEIIETYNNIEVINKLKNGEGLIETKDIKILPHSGVLQIENKWVFPHHLIRSVLGYIKHETSLWTDSKFALSDSDVSSFGAPLYGLSFSQALKKLEKRGIEKARLYCENKKDFSKEGVVAEMLVNLTKDNKGMVSVEVWQGVENSHRVFYMHGIMDESEKYFVHFDGAIIHFDISEKEMLFRDDRKIKGGDYKKLFRIDGKIEQADVFEIASLYFPLDNLIDEYFEVERIK